MNRSTRCLNECEIRRILAIVGSAIFLVLAPGFVAGMVPWSISHWRVEAALLGLPMLRFLGGVLLALGAVGILDSFGRFAIQGIGTPALVFPTRHLVVTGLYRYVRKSDVRGSCQRHSWSGLDPRKHPATRIRRGCLVSVSLICADLRRTNPKSDFWLRVHDLLC